MNVETRHIWLKLTEIKTLLNSGALTVEVTDTESGDSLIAILHVVSIDATGARELVNPSPVTK